MAASAALMQQQRGGIGGCIGVLVGGLRDAERGRSGAEQALKLGLSFKTSSGSGVHSGVHCRVPRPAEVLVSGTIRAVREGMQAECPVAESQNGASILPAFPSMGGAPANEYIGYGVLDEKDNLYRERFVVRFSEEAACNHVLKIGYGAFAGTNGGLVTVTTRMHIEVDRYPAWRDLLEIDTWYCTEGRNAVRRDWTVKDVETDEIIASATSTWVLMHMETKTIQRITDKVRSEFAPWARDPPTWSLSEERIQASSVRIPKIDGDAEFHRTGLCPTERDLDMNQHVNNVKYISWTLESLPLEFRKSHEVSKITLEYRREVGKGDTIESMAKAEPCSINGALSSGQSEGLPQERFIHVIRNQNGQEINKGRTVWTRAKSV